MHTQNRTKPNEKNCNEERNQEDSNKDCEYKADNDSNEVTSITLYRLLIRIRGVSLVYDDFPTVVHAPILCQSSYLEAVEASCQYVNQISTITANTQSE